jgi:hypothetical protein
MNVSNPLSTPYDPSGMELKNISGQLYTILHTLTCYTGRFIMFSVITNIYNKKTKGPTLMELFTTTDKLKKFI